MNWQENVKNHTKTYEPRQRISLSLTQEECKIIEKLSKKHNTKPTSFVKSILLAYINHQPLVPNNIENELKELSFLIRNIANNINQMAHHSHTLKHIKDEQGLLLQLQKLEDTIREHTCKQYS